MGTHLITIMDGTLKALGSCMMLTRRLQYMVRYESSFYDLSCSHSVQFHLISMPMIPTFAITRVHCDSSTKWQPPDRRRNVLLSMPLRSYHIDATFTFLVSLVPWHHMKSHSLVFLITTHQLSTFPTQHHTWSGLWLVGKEPLVLFMLTLMGLGRSLLF